MVGVPLVPSDAPSLDVVAEPQNAAVVIAPIGWQRSAPGMDGWRYRQFFQLLGEEGSQSTRLFAAYVARVANSDVPDEVPDLLLSFAVVIPFYMLTPEERHQAGHAATLKLRPIAISYYSPSALCFNDSLL